MFYEFGIFLSLHLILKQFFVIMNWFSNNSGILKWFLSLSDSQMILEWFCLILEQFSIFEWFSVISNWFLNDSCTFLMILKWFLGNSQQFHWFSVFLIDSWVILIASQHFSWFLILFMVVQFMWIPTNLVQYDRVTLPLSFVFYILIFHNVTMSDLGAPHMQSVPPFRKSWICHCLSKFVCYVRMCHDSHDDLHDLQTALFYE